MEEDPHLQRRNKVRVCNITTASEGAVITEQSIPISFIYKHKQQVRELLKTVTHREKIKLQKTIRNYFSSCFQGCIPETKQRISKLGFIFSPKTGEN